MVDKSRLLSALTAQLEAELAVLTRAAHLARDEAISEESRAESKWDTRGIEAGYLAEGQARMATELAEAIAWYRTQPLVATPPPAPVVVGSVVAVRRGSVTLHGWIGPRAGGTEFGCDGVTYLVVTPASPLGRALLGRRAGETFHLETRGRPQPHQILDTA